MQIPRKKILGIDENKENLIELISNIMETSPVGITTVDSKGNITYANSWAIRVFGLTEDEVTQRTYNTPTWKITDFSGNPFPEEKLPFNLIMSYGKPVVDVRHAIEWPNGKRVFLSINASPLKDEKGNITGMAATIDDITDRIKTEEKLQLSYEELATTEEEIRLANEDLIIAFANAEKIGKQYKQLFENLTVGFALHEIICDKKNIPIDYMFIDVNPAFELLTGLKASEIIGKRVLEILPKTEKVWIEKYGQVALTGKEIEFENYSEELNKYYHVRAYRPQQKQFAVIIEDVTERKKTEERILQSLREKETLIQELFHRTKNTLQLIRGMIILQATEFSENIELQKLVDATEKRIMAISLVHRMLYQKQDLSQISIKEYIEDLSALIMDSFDNTKDRISLNVDIVDQYFLLDIAIPFGLIINELITNSLKYGFPDNRKGSISINLSNDGSGKYILQYSDNGVGVPTGFDFRKQSTLGMKLVFDIGEIQMRGRVNLENKEGISCLFEFPKTLYKARV